MKSADNMFRLIPFLRTHWLIMVVVLLATWLRVWQLDSHAILFSDSGKDLLVAHQAVQDKSLPLLGIASSVPRFKQGPVSIWIEMISIALFGVNTVAVSLIFAFLSIAAVIGLYEYICITVGRKPAILAAAILAVSPLAVAHGRVPYHTTPLPLALVFYFFSLHGLSKKSPWYFLLAGVSFGFLFQFELAVAPLLLLIPFTIWYQKIKVEKKQLLFLLVGLALGVWPQLAYDLTHQFAQLGIFTVWIGHKIIECITFNGGGTTTFATYIQSLVKYGTRLVTVDNVLLSSAIAVLVIFGIARVIIQLKKNKLLYTYLLAYLSFALLLASYFVHGAPSEAYFPPFMIVLPIMITHILFSFSPRLRIISIAGILLLISSNVVAILKYNFFVSNLTSFNYGPSTAEQRQVLEFIHTKSGGAYTLKTFEKHEQQFIHYFDNYKWLALERKIPFPTADAKYFYIQNKNSSDNNQHYFYKDFDSLRVFWLISE